eukprot:11165299-Lingulodinium_polyedra.AAC.1
MERRTAGAQWPSTLKPKEGQSKIDGRYDSRIVRPTKNVCMAVCLTRLLKITCGPKPYDH